MIAQKLCVDENAIDVVAKGSWSWFRAITLALKKVSQLAGCCIRRQDFAVNQSASHGSSTVDLVTTEFCLHCRHSTLTLHVRYVQDIQASEEILTALKA